MRQDIRRSQRGAIGHWLRQAWQSLALVALLAAGLAGPAHAQDASFKNEELDQMLAPIALYPDSLLAQVLMASTYPADVQEAVAWSKAHPDAKGDAAISQVESQSWEPSVKSLAAFPQVLAMMGAKPDDVQRLGDAFLAEPARVMDRVQYLRKKAQEAGNLKTNEQQKVVTETQDNKQVIVVEPAQPNTAYVPVYQPSVYGVWGYPAYPPYYWAPPPYYYPGAAFVGGVIWGAAVVGIANGLWGGCNWGGGNVNINVNKYNNVNVNNKRTTNNTNFNHDAARRGDVPYRDSKSRDQYGAKQRDGAQDREAYRGKDGRDAERSRAENTLKDRGADPAAGREKLQGADRDRANAAARDTNRGAGDAANRSGDRGSPGASQGALSGARDSGGAARANADRGHASTQSMNQRSAPSANRSAPAARPSGGGGASRGGGGGGGGGRAGGGGRGR